MTSSPHISVHAADGQPLNGLGMMILQYLEQNLDEFGYKVREGLRIRCRVAVEVEKGIAITTTFMGEEIVIGNGVCQCPDLHLKSGYLLLANVLSGKANPFWALLTGRMALGAWPKRPIQALRVLRFLKLPSELVM